MKIKASIYISNMDFGLTLDETYLEKEMKKEGRETHFWVSNKFFKSPILKMKCQEETGRVSEDMRKPRLAWGLPGTRNCQFSGNCQKNEYDVTYDNVNLKGSNVPRSFSFFFDAACLQKRDPEHRDQWSRRLPPLVAVPVSGVRWTMMDND